MFGDRQRAEVMLRAALLMLFGLVAVATVLALAAPASAAPPASGDWVVTASESYVNQTIVIEGNVFVRAPGNLTLINVTLEINSTSTARRGLVVESGARLATRDLDGSAATTLDRTFVRPLTNGEQITFVAESGSTLDLRQTAIWGVGYTQSPPNASGVYIKTNATTLRNVSVFSSFFGIVFIGVVGQFQDITVHNNTYNGIDLDAASNISVRGLFAADNGQAGVRVAGGRFSTFGSSLLSNADGIQAVGGTISVDLFDCSGNDNGFRVSGAVLNLSSGRITNSTTAGVDATSNSVVTITNVAFADDANGVTTSLASSVTMQSGGFMRGTHAVRMRSLSTGSFTSIEVRNTVGDAVDMDASSVDFFSSVFDGNALGGSITASTGFGFLDSSISNSTAAGFTFTNSTGIYLHNPLFYNNKGMALDLVGTSNALLDATLVAEINKSTVDVRQLSVLGTLRLVDSTLHGVAAVTWTVTGAFFASNSSIVGDTAGIVLSLGASAPVSVRGLTITDFNLQFLGSSPSTDVDGLSLTGFGELGALGGNLTWRNATQGPGSGRIRGGAGNLTLIGGSAIAMRVEGGARIDAVDFGADLVGASYAAGSIRQLWTTSLLTQWQASSPAPFQSYTVANATGSTVSSGQTDGAGLAGLGAIVAKVGTSGGVALHTPHHITAGAGAWTTVLDVAIDLAGTVTITLTDALPPTLTILSPSAGASISASTVVVTGNLSDVASGVASLAWSFDNSSFTPGTPSDPFSVSVSTPFETSYLVTVRAVDQAGNAAFASVTFRVDRTAPTISLTLPSNNTALRGPLVRFAGGTETGAVLTIDGTVVPLDAFGDFDANLSLAEGDVVATLLAIDPAGNSYTLRVSLHIDSTPPAIIVSSPPEGTTIGATTVDLSGLVEPGASLSVDGISQIIKLNGSFLVNVDLPLEGNNVLTLSSVDRAGNVNQTTWSLVRDTRAPVVVVAGLAGSGPWAINTTAPRFNITTDEFALIEASISPGSTRDNGSGMQLVFSPALSEGNFTLTVRADDIGGNSRTWTYAVRVDLQAPTFTLDARTEVGEVNVNPWTIQITTEIGATVTVGGQAANTTSPGAYLVSAALLQGPNTLLVLVVDAAGNRATRTITITYDTSPPSLSLTTPGSDLTTSDGRVDIVGVTEPGATVTVSGRTAIIPVDATGHFSTAFELQKGANNIVVTATDPAGNSVSVQRTVTRSTGGTLTGIPFLDQNLYAIILLIVLAVAGAAVAARASSKRRALGDRSAMIERDLAGARADRNDMSSLENFSPQGAGDPDFVPAEEFRRQAAQQEAEAKLKGGSPQTPTAQPGSTRKERG